MTTQKPLVSKSKNILLRRLPKPSPHIPKPEPERDRASNIAWSFNELLGNIPWNDKHEVRQVNAEELPPKVAADRAYQNAMKNFDKPNARIEHDRAMERVMTELIADHTELFKQFSDNPGFKKWLSDTIFGVTYAGDASVAPTAGAQE